MMAQMLSPNSGRISQNLPIPKCSTCSQFVPLEELGDHVCSLPPPLPNPGSLLPKRLQGRTPSPGPSASPPSRGPPVSKPSNSPTKATFQPRPSPLANSSVGSQPTNASPSRDISLSINTSTFTRDNPRAPLNANAAQLISTPITARESSITARPSLVPHSGSSPINTPPVQPPSLPVQGRSGTPLGYRGPLGGPSISRSGTPGSVPPGNMIPPRDTSSPALLSPSGSMLPANMRRDTSSPAPQRIVHAATGPGAVIPETHPPLQSFVPPPERGIDTKTGGEAGMAGVGRRGFAAVARAAMFALPPGPQAYRRSDRPKYLDLDVVSRSAVTPPLSAGSGYSSHSPGPTSPLPQSEFPPQTKITRTPSPPHQFLSTPTQPEFSKPASDLTSSNSPLASRFPFLEKFKNKMPGNNPAPNPVNTANNDDSSLNYSTFPPTSIVRKNTSDSIDSVSLYRSTTSSTTSSRPIKDVRRPISPIDSESEYGGLAYADSTDNEDGEPSRSQSKRSHSDMPAFILRAGSTSSARRHRPSGSETSQNGNDRTGILIGSTTPRPGHSPGSSHSSAGGESLTRERSNSAVIAQALGLSQRPPSDYGKIGGPGVMGGRNGSISRRNAKPGSMEEMEKALEEAKAKARNKQPSFGSSSQRSHLYRADTTSTIASSRKDDVIETGGGGPKAHRSNTIQSPRPTSPEKAVKLPMRALTSPKLDRDKALDGTGVRKERVRKAKVCLKCQNVIDNGRWVSVDGGGVLCERCWKNMYLPKCRRCNLSIEKQAVSSSDGQLKGKYHKECFNCETCHKPFPDKTFYVYDGKPLCAYHYHEANDSLCAAALCGQPIEGPCAVSHSGDRYHPEHMTCEYSGYPPCQEMLSEYWEIDGRMLCERHANSASVCGSDEEDEGWAKSKRRVTRFIDLTQGGVEGVGDSELR